MDEIESAAPDMFPKRVGERLADARRAAGLDLSDLAARTRIPQRHLEALETGRFVDLPATTYAVGFAKSYARALELDEAEIAREMRAEIELHGGRPQMPDYFQPADPARVPPRTLVWTAAALALIVAVGYGVFRSDLMDGLGGRDPMAVAAGTDELDSPAEAPAPANAAAPATPASGEVVLTATGPVWLRITDASEQRLFEKEMAAGERYLVPADAREPKIVTGRPDAIQVTVGGQPVAPLGPPETTIRDVGISAAALAARPPLPANAQSPPPTGQP